MTTAWSAIFNHGCMSSQGCWSEQTLETTSHAIGINGLQPKYRVDSLVFTFNSVGHWT